MTKACRSHATAAWFLAIVACGLTHPSRAQAQAASAASAVAAPSAAVPAPAPSAEAGTPALEAAPALSAVPGNEPETSSESPPAAELENAPLANAGPFAPLLADLRAHAEVVRGLRARMETAPEIARAVLSPQIFDASSDYRRALTEAVTTLASGAFADAPPTARQHALAVVTQRLSEEGRVIRQSVRSQYRASLVLIERVADAKSEERPNLEHARNTTLEHLPVLLQEYRENLQARERLKQDVRADETVFERQLLDAAKFTTGLLKGVAEENVQLRRSFGAAPKPDEQARLSALRSYRKRLADLQKKQIQLLDEYGTNTVKLRQDLITTTGDVEAIFDTDVMSGLFKKWKTDAVNGFTDNAVSFALRAATVLLIVLVFVVVARLSRRLVRRALARTNFSLSHLASEFIVAMSGRAIVLIGIFVALAQLGLEVGPLLAGLGIAGFVVGFALQDTLSNFASGMMILMYRPFDVGDTIEAGGTIGQVKAMTLVSTSVLTFDNQMLIVPNNKIWGDVIRNLTHQTTRRVDLLFRIGYHDDLEHAERVLIDIVNEHPLVLREPEPVIRVHELADSSIKFVVRPWVKTDDYWETYWAITREVKRRFDSEGISIPFPQSDVHLRARSKSEREGERDLPSPVAARPAPSGV